MSKSLLTSLLLFFAVLTGFGQEITVHGTVLSKSDGEPLIGASVTLTRTNFSVVTDIDGTFTLKATNGAQIKVSYVGYNDFVGTVAPEMNIELAENTAVLDEVVVVGYSAEKKSDLTGSVAVVKMKDVADTPTGNVLQALQGRVAGMNITTDGTPGGTSTGVSIRGASSFRSDANSPLYVIDGVMTRDNIATILNSNDIESIQVLKDASSAAIYGAQAANGVVIITTKRAAKGETHVTFDATLTAQTYQSGIDLLNADQWGEVYWAAYKYANNGATPNSAIYGNGATPQLQNYTNINGAQVLAGSTDWEDEIHRTALMQTYSIGLTKGTDNGSSSLSLSWLDHDGIVKGTDFQRVNSRLSSDYGYLNNRLKAGGNLAVNWWKAHYAPDGVEEGAIKQHPAKVVYDTNGDYNDAISDVLGDTPNHLRLIENNANNKHEYWRMFGNAYLSVEPVKNLIIKTNFGVNYYNESNKTFEPKWMRDDVNKLSQSTVKNVDWVWTNTAQYNIDFGKHSLMALLGYEAKRNHSESLSGYGCQYGVWECPDMMELPVQGSNEKKWMLVCNINPGGPFGGSATQYFVGDFDGKTFTCNSKQPQVTKWMDYGMDHYATVSWSNAPQGRHTVIAWMSNWLYANDVPTMQYRSANSLPRDLGLFKDKDGEYYVTVKPSPEVDAMRGNCTSYCNATVTTSATSYKLPTSNDGACEIEFDVDIRKSKNIQIVLSNSIGEEVVMNYDVDKGTFAMNREKSGITNFSTAFACTTIAPLHNNSGKQTLRLFIDRCSIEAFDGNGRFAMTNLVFPTSPYTDLIVSTANSTARINSLNIFQLNINK